MRSASAAIVRPIMKSYVETMFAIGSTDYKAITTIVTQKGACTSDATAGYSNASTGD